MDIVEGEEVDVVEEMEKNRKIKKMLQIMPKVLTEREYDILVKRYGLYQKKPLTQREIAKEFGISRSYVSRIEKKALDKMKLHFSEE